MPNNDITDLTHLDEAINRTHDFLSNTDPGTDEHAKVLDQLTKLYDIRKKHIAEAPPAPEPVIDKDRARLKDWIPVIGSVLGIVVIVAYEAAGHVVTSKATGFVSKMK